MNSGLDLLRSTVLLLYLLCQSWTLFSGRSTVHAPTGITTRTHLTQTIDERTTIISRGTTTAPFPFLIPHSAGLVLCQTSVCTRSADRGTETPTRASTRPTRPNTNNDNNSTSPLPLLPLHPARARVHPCRCVSPSTLPPLPRPPPRLLPGGKRDGGETSMTMENQTKRRRCLARANAILASCLMTRRRRTGRQALRGRTTQLHRCVDNLIGYDPLPLTFRACADSDQHIGEGQRTNPALFPYGRQVRRHLRMRTLTTSLMLMFWTKKRQIAEQVSCKHCPQPKVQCVHVPSHRLLRTIQVLLQPLFPSRRPIPIHTRPQNR